jgi:SOS response regulatory protein OraA/RecX
VGCNLSDRGCSEAVQTRQNHDVQCLRKEENAEGIAAEALEDVLHTNQADQEYSGLAEAVVENVSSEQATYLATSSVDTMQSQGGSALI